MGQHRTATAPDYRTDFFGWTQHQAKLLLTLRRLGAQLPAELDLDRVAEEVQDLGGAELTSVKSLVRQTMVHLVKAASDPGSAASKHWRSEAASFHADNLDRYATSMRRDIDLQPLWRRARDLAELQLQEHDRTLVPVLPKVCPFAVDDFMAEKFSFDGMLKRICPANSAANQE